MVIWQNHLSELCQINACNASRAAGKIIRLQYWNSARIKMNALAFLHVHTSLFLFVASREANSRFDRKESEMKYSKYELIMKKSKVHESKYDYRITCSDDVYRFATKIMRLHEKAEEFFCIVCNTKLDITGVYTIDSFCEISHGCIDSSMVHPREVFKNAIALNASCIVAIHNHPSGSSQESQQDIDVTKRLAECGRLIGIPVMDHIIIGNGEYTSMKQKGYM